MKQRGWGTESKNTNDCECDLEKKTASCKPTVKTLFAQRSCCKAIKILVSLCSHTLGVPPHLAEGHVSSSPGRVVKPKATGSWQQPEG